MKEEVILVGPQESPRVGVLHRPDSPFHATPLLLLVGGPQTRVGSHRQFVLLSRYLCQRGVPVVRFDYQGMGDSLGNGNFLTVLDDVRMGVDAVCQHTGSDKVAIWGLCDAASLALLYLSQNQDERVTDLILLNPWVRQADTEAKTMLRYYYLRRLLHPAFWRKLITMNVNFKQSLGEIANFWRRASGTVEAKKDSSPGLTEQNYVSAMLVGLDKFQGKVNLVLSGCDLTADEFRVLYMNDQAWKKSLDSKLEKRLELDDANHTFSSAQWRSYVERFTAESLGIETT